MSSANALNAARTSVVGSMKSTAEDRGLSRWDITAVTYHTTGHCLLAFDKLREAALVKPWVELYVRRFRNFMSMEPSKLPPMNLMRYLTARRLFGPHSAEVAGLESEDLGPYEGIRKEWDTLAGRVDLITDILDIHMKHAKEAGNNTGWFEGPWMMFPLEYLALRKVRQHEGLDTPTPKYHVLLESPLAYPPEVLPPMDDDLVIRYLASVRKVFPDF